MKHKVKNHTRLLLDVKTKASKLLELDMNESDKQELSQQSAILEMQIESGIKTIQLKNEKTI